jgi:hypothetical protein
MKQILKLLEDPQIYANAERECRATYDAAARDQDGFNFQAWIKEDGTVFRTKSHRAINIPDALALLTLDGWTLVTQWPYEEDALQWEDDRFDFKEIVANLKKKCEYDRSNILGGNENVQDY